MASVTESSLDMAAHEIVASFTHDSVTLNDGVIKKAAELSLNKDQTCRLIERTNSEAFLSKFPASTDFDVADPNVILKVATTYPIGDKTASVVKTASYKKASYEDQLNRDMYDIFGIEEPVEKTAAISRVKTDFSAREVFAEKIASAAESDMIGVEKAAKLIEMEAAESNLWGQFRNEVLSGRSVSDIERQLVLSNPEKTAAVCETVTYLVEKLAAATHNVPGDYARLQVEDIDADDVVLDDAISKAFRRMV